MRDWITIKTMDEDGWAIEVAITADDIHPADLIDCLPAVEERDWYSGQPERDYDGRYLPQPINVSWDRDYVVSVEEIARLRDLGISRDRIESDAHAIVSGDLSLVVVRVTARCGGVEGTDILGGVEYDARRDPEADVLATIEDHEMVASAINDGAQSVLGGLAPLALSY